MVFITTYSQNLDSAQFYFKKGMTEKAGKRFLAASNFFEKSTQFNPKNIDAYVQNAYVNIDMHKTDAAIRIFERINELEPVNEIASTNLMDLYYNYRMFQKAIQLASKCKTCSNRQRMIGLCNYQLGLYSMAIKTLPAAVENNPKDAELNYALAKSYIQLEKIEDAYPYFIKAIQLDATKNRWMYELGTAYYNHSDYKNAAVYLEKAIASGLPVNNDITETLGYSLLYSADFEKGEKMLALVLENKPGSKTILTEIADAFYEQKKYDKCIVYLQKLIDINPKDAKVIYQAGLCYQKKGEKEFGQKMCDKAIDMDASLANLRQQKMSSVGL